MRVAYLASFSLSLSASSIAFMTMGIIRYHKESISAQHTIGLTNYTPGGGVEWAGYSA
jgi:hypothetical protein